MHKKIYIEAGANDGVFQSRSLSFKDNEEYFGILIEPHKPTFDLCVTHRANDRTQIFNCALVPFTHKEEFVNLFRHNASAMNSIISHEREQYIGGEPVPARTLQSILDELNISEVEFFFLDVEGFEFEVLQGVDLSKTKFKELEVESHYPFLGLSFEEDKQRFVDFFTKNNYNLAEVIHGDGLPKLIFRPNE